MVFSGETATNRCMFSFFPQISLLKYIYHCGDFVIVNNWVTLNNFKLGFCFNLMYLGSVSMTIPMKCPDCMVLHHRLFKQFLSVGNLDCFSFFSKNRALENMLKTHLCDFL